MGALFEVLMGFLKDLLFWFGLTLYNFLIDLINGAIVLIADCFSWLIGLLPGTSVNLQVPAGLSVIAAQINWFIPVSSVVASLGLMATAYVAFFVIRPIAKFLHLA